MGVGGSTEAPAAAAAGGAAAAGPLCAQARAPLPPGRCAPACRVDEAVVSSDGAGLADAVKAATGGSLAYAAIDCVGGDLFAAVAGAVRNAGTVIIYGAMSGLTASFRWAAWFWLGGAVPEESAPAQVYTRLPLSAPSTRCSIPDPLFRGVTIRGYWINNHIGRCVASSHRMCFYLICCLKLAGSSLSCFSAGGTGRGSLNDSPCACCSAPCRAPARTPPLLSGLLADDYFRRYDLSVPCPALLQPVGRREGPSVRRCDAAAGRQGHHPLCRHAWNWRGRWRQLLPPLVPRSQPLRAKRTAHHLHMSRWLAIPQTHCASSQAGRAACLHANPPAWSPHLPRRLPTCCPCLPEQASASLWTRWRMRSAWPPPPLGAARCCWKADVGQAGAAAARSRTAGRPAAAHQWATE